jgi:uncharacterized damage-inducible protein DinB
MTNPWMAMNSETGSERELLEAHLDANRSDVVRKVTGLSWEQATTRLGATATSAAGILKHLIDVERWWFRFHLDGQPDVPFASTDENPDGDFELGPEDTLESLIGKYAIACDESRAIAARHDLDDQCRTARRNDERPSLRWIYIHMIEELARHNGHLDIYRELIDGQVDCE